MKSKFVFLLFFITSLFLSPGKGFSEEIALYLFKTAEYADFAKIIHKEGKSQLPKTMMKALIVKDIQKDPFDKSNIVSEFLLNDYRDTKGSEAPYVTTIGDDILELCFDNGLEDAPTGPLAKKLKFAAHEGQGGGKMDFRFSCEFYDDDRIYLVDGIGIAYNTYDLGNFLWGAGMKRLGIPYSITKIGSEYNAIFYTYKQNPDLKKPWHGLSLKGDSVEDQRAIKKGYFSKYGSKVKGSPDLSE